VRRLIAFVIAGVPVSSNAATIATDEAPAPAPVAIADARIDTAHEADVPRDIVIGRFFFEPYMVTVGSRSHKGGRFGIDMVGASGDGPTRLAGGIRFLLGGDGGAAIGPEGQLQIGVAHAIADRAVVALVAPLGFMIGGGDGSFEPRGYAGIEGVAALGRFDRDHGPSVKGVEIAAGISTRGARARLGIVRPGKEMGFGFGVDWQRDGDTELFGLYLASVAGR
jgi:hypothetical protein